MRRRLSHSIFLKLLAIYGVAFLHIILGGLFLHVYSSLVPNIEVSLDNVRYYATVLSSEIGDPPEAETAQRIAMESGLNLAITGPDFVWTNNDEFLERVRNYRGEPKFPRLLSLNLEDRIVQVNKGPYLYSFSGFSSENRSTTFIWVFMSIVIFVSLLFSYLMVRLLLKPLRKMDRVAREFGASDWKLRVDPKGNDEFSRLGRTMDAMADRIEQYIVSMQRLIVAISHEFRSPLTRIKMALEFVGDEKIKRSINEEIRALDQLTGTLLEQKQLVAGNSTLRLEPLELHKWISSLCEPYLYLETPLRLELDAANRTIRLDRARMSMAIRNLIENALKHAPGSAVTVALLPGEDGGFSISVSDSGPGMPESLLARIGEPFLLGEPSRTGPRGDGGYGLGLTITRAVAEAHGATFSARNLEPHGFSVTISFRDRDSPS